MFSSDFARTLQEIWKYRHSGELVEKLLLLSEFSPIAIASKYHVKLDLDHFFLHVQPTALVFELYAKISRRSAFVFKLDRLGGSSNTRQFCRRAAAGQHCLC